jgi:hypothetical protein
VLPCGGCSPRRRQWLLVDDPATQSAVRRVTTHKLKGDGGLPMGLNRGQPNLPLMFIVERASHHLSISQRAFKDAQLCQCLWFVIKHRPGWQPANVGAARVPLQIAGPTRAPLSTSGSAKDSATPIASGLPSHERPIRAFGNDLSAGGDASGSWHYRPTLAAAASIHAPRFFMPPSRMKSY